MKAIPQGRALGGIFILLVAALLAVLIFRPGAESAAAVDLGDPNAWIEHGIDGELLQINALTGEVTSRIDVAEPGETFVALPVEDGAVVLNTSTSAISLVSGSQLTVTSTIDLPLADGVEGRQPALFGRDDVANDVTVVDGEQVVSINSESGDVAPLTLDAPLSSPVQDASGAIFAFDAEASTVVQLGVDGPVAVATVADAIEGQVDERTMVSAGGSVYALDPQRLALAQVEDAGSLGNAICMRSAAGGAVHGGSTPDSDAVILSLNPASSVLAVSTGDGGCRDIDVDVEVGEYGAPIAHDGVAYLPFWEGGRIIAVDLESGQTISELPFGTLGQPFELEVFGSTVWANERLGPFAAVVRADEIVPVAKISAIVAAPGNADEDGDGSSLSSGDEGENRLRLLGDSGEAVIAAEGDAIGGADSGTGENSNQQVVDVPNAAPVPQPEAFGIAVDVSDLGDGQEPPLPELAETLVANFSVSSSEATVGETVRFTDTSLGSPVAWSWTFGDGDGAERPNAEKAWAEEGIFTVTLTVTNAAGDVSSQATEVAIVPETVLLAPNADFQFSQATIEAGESITFESRTTGEVDIFRWTFGDGNRGRGRRVTHTFEEAGTFEVELTASNDAGSDTATATVEVLSGVEPPVAGIGQVPRRIVTDQQVTFESTSLNDPTTISWDFGDGTTASGASVRHSFARAGEYRVALVVENSEGEDRTFVDITVEQRVIAPVSVFTQSATEVLVGERVRFTSSALNNPTQHRWSFGDGSTADGVNSTHSWSEPGTFRVMLRVENEAGDDRSGVNITVVEPVDPPVASFNVSETVVATGEDVRFTDTSRNRPTRWRWEFENAGEATVQNPVRAWQNQGTFTVRLVAINEGGRSSTETQIRVVDRPTADFRFEMVDDDTVRFIDQSENVTGWRWDFGDGSTSNERNPTHTFRGGSFDVTLTTSNQVGSATDRARITVSNPPEAVATCRADGARLVCSGQDSERATGFRWSAEDAVSNSNPTGETTTFLFDRSGRPEVTLVVTGNDGSTDRTTIRAPEVQAGREPRVLDVVVDSIDGDLVRLRAEFDRDPTRWQWEIDGVELVDGGNSPTPLFRVPGNGRFRGQVTAANDFGDDRDPVSFRVDAFDTTASFTWEGIAPGVIQFVNTSDAQDDAEITWRFNGAVEIIDNNEQRPVVRFRETNGTFRVIMTVRDDNGSDTARADVSPPPPEDEPPPEEEEPPPEEEEPPPEEEEPPPEEEEEPPPEEEEPPPEEEDGDG